MIRPPYLSIGDTIGIAAPAGCLKESEIEKAVALFKSWGLTVKSGRHLFASVNSFAGNDRQRAADFQQMLDDKDIKAIICARGGYGSVRIVDKLDFTGFLQSPKWIAGYSDITILHAVIQHLGVESIHGPMPRIARNGLPDLVSFDSLQALLFGKIRQYSLPPHKLNITGKAKGMLVGGNLSVLCSFAGAPYDIDTTGKVMFIEDLNEQLYHIDRMMMNLKITGKLDHLAALVVGYMTRMKKSDFHKPAYKIIHELASEHKYPVMFGFPAGHDRPNLALPMGREVTLSVGEKECVLGFK